MPYRFNAFTGDLDVVDTTTVSGYIKQLDADAGSALPVADIINLVGTAVQGISTSATGNTVTFTIADSTETQKGVVELATDAEAISGTLSDNHVINPSSLKAKLGAQTDHGLLVGAGSSNAITTLTVGSTGELLTGQTGGDPLFSSYCYGDFSFANVTSPATPRTLVVSNTDVDAASTAALQLSIPPLGGDNMLIFEVQGSSFYSLGVDNSDSDTLKITTSSDPSSGIEAFAVDNTTGAITFANAYEFPIADGTARYPLVTDGAGNIDFSALTVAGGGTGSTSITDHSLIVGSGTGAVTEIGPLTNGQLIIGSTGNDPVAASLTSTGGTVTITPGAGSINLESAGGGGGLATVITTITHNNTTGDADFTNIGTYDYYEIIFQGVSISGTANLYMYTSTDNGSSFDSSDYFWKFEYLSTSTNEAYNGVDSGSNRMQLVSTLRTGYDMCGKIKIFDPTNASTNFGATFDIGWFAGSTPWAHKGNGFIGRLVTESVNAFRLSLSANNWNTGKFILIGYDFS